MRLKANLAADGALVLTTLVWGTTFFMAKDILASWPPLGYMAVRFGLAAVVLVALFSRTVARANRAEWRAGATLGLLLGLGLTVFSMNGPDVPEVKKIIRSTTLEHARQVARKVMSFDSERQVMHFLREETRKIIPEAF